SFFRECISACPSSPFERLECLESCADTYGEDDEYAFICPGEYTVTDIAILPSSDLRISFTYKDKLDSYFVITDTYGNKYYYGQKDESRETTTTNYKDNKALTEYDEDNSKSFISSWQLDRIVYANLPEDEGISFGYTPATIIDEQESYRMPMNDLNLYYQCIKNCSGSQDCNECDMFDAEMDGSIPDNPNVDPVPIIAAEKHNEYRNNLSTLKQPLLLNIFLLSTLLKDESNSITSRDRILKTD
ncbi:MAG: hypothetical protein AAFY41_06900, partial [Bacteroidota bacterium]